MRVMKRDSADEGVDAVIPDFGETETPPRASGSGSLRSIPENDTVVRNNLEQGMAESRSCGRSDPDGDGPPSAAAAAASLSKSPVSVRENEAFARTIARQGHHLMPTKSIMKPSTHGSVTSNSGHERGGGLDCGGGGAAHDTEHTHQLGEDLNSEENSIEEDEMFARDNAESRPLALFFWNGFSSFLVLLRYLISIDAIFGAILSCVFTWYVYHLTNFDDTFDGSMSFILLGFAVLMPFGVSVRIVFARREKALENIASMQTHAHSIYLCHAAWDWGKAPGERSKDPDRWIRHSDECLRVLISIGDELTHFLTLPNSSFSRHRETRHGRKEAAVTVAASYRIFVNIIKNRIAKLAMLCEDMKLAGFSPSEASRVRQYEKLLTNAVQNLRMFKMYRSPKALNALLNLTTTLLPPFYAPAFAQIAHDTGSLAVALAFATIVSLALSALYESVQVLEDPFVAFLTLDGIDVYEELVVLYYHQLVETRQFFFPDAPSFQQFDDEIKDGERSDKGVLEEEEKPVPALDHRAMMMNQHKGSVCSMNASSRRVNLVSKRNVLMHGSGSSVTRRGSGAGVRRNSLERRGSGSGVRRESLGRNDRRVSLKTIDRRSVFALDLK